MLVMQYRRLLELKKPINWHLAQSVFPIIIASLFDYRNSKERRSSGIVSVSVFFFKSVKTKNDNRINYHKFSSL